MAKVMTQKGVGFEPGADPGFAKGGGPWRARGARAYNGGLGAEPPAGSREPLVGVQGGEAP